jgi:hypothetical protein
LAESEKKSLEPVQVDCWAVDLLEETDVCTFRCEYKFKLLPASTLSEGS